jgi:Na+-driven multidrug efflux pump
MLLAVPILLFPGQLLYPLLGKEDMSLIGETQPVFYFLLGLLSFSTFGAVLMNALSGTGATWFGLKLQAFCVSLYLGYIYWVTNFTQLGLLWVWASEVLYWMLMILMTLLFLRSAKWHDVRF